VETDVTKKKIAKMKTKLVTTLGLLLLSSFGYSQKPSVSPLTSFIDSVSYAYGVGLGSQIEKSGVKLNYNLVFKGLVASNTPETIMTPDQITGVMAKFQNQLRAVEQAKIDKEADANLSLANQFLEANKKKAEVVTTESGLQYEVITKVGTASSPSPVEGDKVVVNFEGYFCNDQKFDSSFERKTPITIEMNNAIDGWKEALKLMKEGDMYMLFVPPHLGYGKEGYDMIPPNELLKFKLELVKIIPGEPKAEQL